MGTSCFYLILGQVFNFIKINIDTIIVYSTMPEGKIVGDLTIEKILVDKLEELWKLTKGFSGVSYPFFKK